MRCELIMIERHFPTRCIALRTRVIDTVVTAYSPGYKEHTNTHKLIVPTLKRSAIIQTHPKTDTSIGAKTLQQLKTRNLEGKDNETTKDISILFTVLDISVDLTRSHLYKNRSK